MTGRRTRASAREVLTLSDDWRVWVVDNTLRGVARADLVRTLVANGVPRRTARREVDAIQASPALVACQRLALDVERLEMVAKLRQTLAGLGPSPAEVPRRSGVSADAFYARYFEANEPVVLTDMMAGWKATSRWSLPSLRERLGEVAIEICAGREADPECDKNFEAHRETTTMAAYLDRVEAAGVTNDFYFVANNRNIEREALRVLFDDVVINEAYFDPGRRDGAVSLWIGPAGTVTPLHHDTTNILFCQVIGRKRVMLISPLETALLKHARGFYSAIDAERDLGQREDLEGVTVKTVELSAGEALFIPVGWWHHVRALEVSVNFSLMNFRRPNKYEWYRPGKRR